MAELPLIVNLKIGNMSEFKRNITSAIGGAGQSGGSGGAPGIGTIGKAAVVFTVIQKGVEAMVGLLKGVFEQMKAASPALQGLELMFQKALLIFFQPFGNFLATILKPAMALLIRWVRGFNRDVSKTFEQVLKQPNVGVFTTNPLEPQQDPLQGGFSAILPTKEEQKQIASNVRESVQQLTDNIKQGADESAKGILEASFNFGESLRQAIASASPEAVSQLLVAFVEGLLNIIWALIELLGAVIVGLAAIIGGAIAGFIQFLVESIEIVVEGLGKIFDSWLKILGILFSMMLTEVQKRFMQIVEWIQTTFDSSLKSVLSSIVSTIRGAADFLAGLLTQAMAAANEVISSARGAIFGSNAMGSDFVPRTGLYELHRGEQVIPASQAGKQNQGTNQTINMTTNVKIEATINNDEDIARIAEKLAIMQKESMRRGLSYG